MQIDGCTGSYTLEAQEQLTTALLNDLVVAGQSAGVLNVDLLIPIWRVNSERGVLEAHGGFQMSGTVQTNEDGHAVTYAQYRHATSRSGSVDGNLAVAPPTIAASPLEVEGVELMRRRMSEPVSDAKIAALHMGHQYDGHGYQL